MKSIDTNLGKKIKPFILVALLIGIVYFPALFNQFVNWDDDVHLTHNYFIQTPDDRFIQRIFSTTVNGTYNPLTMLTFAIEHHFFGNTPFIYHLNNVLLHIAVTLLIIPIALRFGLTLTQGICASVLFGLHPMHVESVAWVTERKDVLYAVFYLLGILVYLRYISLTQEGKTEKNEKTYYVKKYGYFLLTIICGILSALAKPMALSFPIILGLCDHYFRRPLKLFVMLEKLLIGIWLIPIGLITLTGVVSTEKLSLFKSVLFWSWSLSFYVYKFLFMDFFVLLYKSALPISLTNPEYFFSLIIVIASIAVCVIYRKNRLFIFSFMFYLGSIFLVLRWDAVNVVADRFMYLPSLGICLGIGAVWGNVLGASYPQRWKKNLVSGSLLLFLIVLGVKTHQQILVWRNSVSLWEHQMVYQPQAAMALTYNKLASAYADEMGLKEKLKQLGIQGLNVQDQTKYQKISGLYQAALAIKPDYADTLFRLASIYKAAGELAQSEDYLWKTIKADPDHFEAYLDLGEIYWNRGDRPSAEAQFQKAMAINPDNQHVVRRMNKIRAK